MSCTRLIVQGHKHTLLENAHPEAVLLVAGDFNAGKLKSVLPYFYQHVKCATRGETRGGKKHTKLSLAIHLANLPIILSS
jgi:hypothetical protein